MDIFVYDIIFKSSLIYGLELVKLLILTIFFQIQLDSTFLFFLLVLFLLFACGILSLAFSLCVGRTLADISR